MKYTKLTPRLDRRGGTEEERKAIRHLCRGGGIKKVQPSLFF
jgi:hypothetical protein